MNLSSKDGYKCIPFISMLYITLSLCHVILVNKLLTTWYGVMCASSLVLPLCYLMDDIIAEVYGFRMARKLYWSAYICQILFGLICYALMKLHSPDFWHKQADYDVVLGHVLHITIYGMILSTIIWRINVYFLLKWKFLLRGKYFWLRSIGATSIGAILMVVIGSPVLLLFGTVPNVKVMISTALWACFLRIFFLFILAFPSTIVVLILRLVEGIDLNPAANNFNPFRTELPSKS